jgi:hypothetical protein
LGAALTLFNMVDVVFSVVVACCCFVENSIPTPTTEGCV